MYDFPVLWSHDTHKSKNSCNVMEKKKHSQQIIGHLLKRRKGTWFSNKQVVSLCKGDICESTAPKVP